MAPTTFSNAPTESDISATSAAVHDYDEASFRIVQILHQYPELRSAAAKGLNELADELEKSTENLPAAPGGRPDLPPLLSQRRLRMLSAPDEHDVHMLPYMWKQHADVLKGDHVIDRLKHGFLRFHREYFLKETEMFSALAKSQSPKVMLFACCDSRVDPTILLGLTPGEVFQFRNIANLIPPWEKQGRYHATSAALEYAVKHLKVEHILVLGHRNCGGIGALMDKKNEGGMNDFIDDWMDIALPARQRTMSTLPDEDRNTQCRYCEKEAVNVSLLNLLTFPWIKAAVAGGNLKLHGWYYDFVEGSMDTWNLQMEITELERLVTDTSEFATKN